MWPSVPFGSCFFKLSRRSDTIQPFLYVLCSPWLKTSPRYKFSCDTTQPGQSNPSYLPWRWSRMCGQGWWSSLQSSLMKGESRWWRGAWGEPGFILKSESTEQPLWQVAFKPSYGLYGRCFLFFSYIFYFTRWRHIKFYVSVKNS